MIQYVHIWLQIYLNGRMSINKMVFLMYLMYSLYYTAVKQKNFFIFMTNKAWNRVL